MTKSKAEERSTPFLVTATEGSTASSQATAGRELDEQIALRVMGGRPNHVHHYRYHVEPDDGNGASRGYFCEICNPNGYSGVLSGEPYDEGKSTAYARPRYSTDIAAAWEVVERLAPRFDFYLRRVSTWTAEFSEVDSSSDLVIEWHAIGGTADGETAPLAICLAALKAVGA